MAIMKNLGETLKNARDAKGVSVEDASDVTKIRIDYIKSMENGDFDFDLPEIYKKGFLRLYANYLDLDQNAIMADYYAFAQGRKDKESAKAHKVKEQFIRDIVSNSDIDPNDANPEDRYTEDSKETSKISTSNSQLLKIGSVLALVVVAVVVLVFAITSITSRKSSAQNNTVIVQAKAITVKITALKNASFKIAEESPLNSVLFDGILMAGESKEFSSDFSLIFTPENKQIENFEIEKNGVKLNTSGLNKTENYRLKAPNL